MIRSGVTSTVLAETNDCTRRRGCDVVSPMRSTYWVVLLVGACDGQASSSSPARQEAGSWCLVVGSPLPYAALDRAQTLAGNARRAGARDAAVFDARDFLDQSSNEPLVAVEGHGLVVIAGRHTDPGAQEVLRQALEDADLEVSNQPCQPASPTPLPIATPADLRLPIPRTASIPTPLMVGCFGASERRASSVCVAVSEQGFAVEERHRKGESTVRFAGRQLTSAQRAELDAFLLRNRFTAAK